MTFQEFLYHYKDLADTFGIQQFNANRGKLIFRFVEDLPKHWWRGTVEHMIITNKPNYSVAEAAQAERRAINSAKRAKEESDAMENLMRNATDAGKENALKQFKAKSLLEAVENSKKGRVG